MEALLAFAGLAGLIYFFRPQIKAAMTEAVSVPLVVPGPASVPAPSTEELLAAQRALAAANELKAAAEVRAMRAEATAAEAVAGQQSNAASRVAEADQARTALRRATEEAAAALRMTQEAAAARETALRNAADLYARLQPEAMRLSAEVSAKTDQLRFAEAVIYAAKEQRWTKATQIDRYQEATRFWIEDDHVNTRPYEGDITYVDQTRDPAEWARIAGDRSGARFRGLGDPHPLVRLSAGSEPSLLGQVAEFTRSIESASEDVTRLKSELSSATIRLREVNAQLVAASQTLHGGSGGSPGLSDGSMVGASKTGPARRSAARSQVRRGVV